MVNKKYTISIIREARIDENRTPITPNQVKELIKRFPNLMTKINKLEDNQAKLKLELIKIKDKKQEKIMAKAKKKKKKIVKKKKKTKKKKKR